MDNKAQPQAEPNNLDQQKIIVWILTSQLLCLIPLFKLVPIWIVIVCLGVGIWRLLVAKYRYPLPNRAITFIVGVVAALAIVQTYGTLVSREAGVSLIVLMFSLKLLEMRHFRDAILILFLSYFLLVVNFLYYENVFIVFYLFLTVFVITIALVILNSRENSMPYRRLVSFTGSVLSMALPLAAMLFVFFPRLSEPLWQIPGDSSATSGFSDTMSPGSISELFESDKIAFRVKYKQANRDIANQYWRGLVLSEYDGVAWRESSAKSIIKPVFKPLGESSAYMVMLEPHSKKWLFSAEMSVSESKGLNLFDDFTLESDYNINSVFSYKMTSYEQYEFEKNINPVQKRANLDLPNNDNQLTSSWARKQRQSMASDREFVEFVLEHIRNKDYFYTLRPPIYEENIIDDFWFSGRRGYCEHYSSAFVFIMRAANIPARVVVGYSGGDYNPYGGYLIVRANDAHAWTEVWFPDVGWERIDPTSFIHPSRVEKNLADAFEQRSANEVLDDQSFLDNYVSDLSKTELFSFMLDAIQNGWNEWFIGFDKNKQLSLFRNLGFDLKSTFELFKWMILLLIIMVAVIGLNLVRKRKTGDKITRAFTDMEQRLKRKKIELQRQRKEAPIAYLQRIAKTLPEQQARLQAIERQYSRLRYQDNSASSSTELDKLLRTLKEVKA